VLRPDTLACLCALVVLGAACASSKPVLYPNAKLEQVGDGASKHDIDECMELAKNADLEKNKNVEVAKRTGTGAAIGAVTGAVVGAILGVPGTGAAAGAAGGGISGFFSGLFSTKEQPQVYKNYVDTCLRERGYQPVGWK